MNLRPWFPILLLSSLAFSLDTATPPQAATTGAVQPPATSTPSALSRASRPAVGKPHPVTPVTEVISINGLCKPGEKRHECNLSITRAQFEALISVLPQERGQPMTPLAKKQFATQYSHLLVLAGEAEKQGLQNTQEGRELVQYARLQALAQVMTHQLRATTQPTAEEIKNYYTANQDRFRELTLQRVFIPASQVSAGKMNEAERRALADELHQRAATVDDFSELQAEVNDKAGINDPPESRIVLPASALPFSQEAVLQLKVGELSPIIQDSTGLLIYKLEATKILPFEMEAQQIQEDLAGIKMQQQVDKLVSASKPVLNPQYFQQASAKGPRSARKTITIRPQQPFRPASPVGTALSR